MAEHRLSENRFDVFYREKGYAALKRSLFNYRLRKWKIRKHVPATGLILDIGSGIAPMSPDLGRTVLADISAEAMRTIDLPVREKLVMSVTDISFGASAFNCIICSEVLEHVEEDTRALSEMKRVLAPGGTLIITVPFQKKYWGEDDDFVGHKRRYESGELEEKLKDAGFSTVKTYRLSGKIERFLTIQSLRYYLKSGESTKRSVWLYRSVNYIIFLFLLVAEFYISRDGTTRILIVAK